jgi:hypothetical protein
MKFEVTPEEAQPAARAMIKHFKKLRMKVKVERPPWPTAPYRTTLVAEKAGRHVLVEAQGTLSYSRSLKEMMAWIEAKRLYAELYVATISDAILQVGALQEMKSDGVGLFVIGENGVITEHQRARNPALVINPDPTLAFGALKQDVRNAVQKFNEVDRKDGLRDMCEVVERLTDEVAATTSRKGWVKIPEADFTAKDWASQINELARKEIYHPPHSPVITSTMKDDLHSFRNARNLVDHKVRSRRDDTKRQKQFAERMMQGPRLVAELLSLKRKIK